ncbi:MAG: glycosyltransferase family 2 protein [Chloroflexota bacterium]
MSALVSIVIPAYNSADFITMTLDSCLAQTYPHVEIIVVDDGSTDNTVDVVRAYGDKVCLIQQANQGPAIARNTGVDAAQGEFIQLCDSDDLLLPTKIERCVPLIQNKPEVALAFCQMIPVDEAGVVVSDTQPYPMEDSGFFSNDDLFCKILRFNGSPIQTSTWLIRKTALQAVGGLRGDSDLRGTEDWDVLLRLASAYEFAGIPEILVHYRHRSGALTQQPIKMAKGRLTTIRYARDYEGRTDCFSDSEYDALEASRYHVLAMTLWHAGDTKGARDAFRTAIRIHPPHARMRRLYTWLSYIAPASVVNHINAILS